jgi:hypothetical protein
LWKWVIVSESRSGEGARSGDTNEIASEIVSEVVEVGSRAGGSEDGGGSRRVSSREPLAAVVASESLGLWSEEQKRDVGAAQGTSGKHEGAGTSRAPSTLTPNSGAETISYESACGLGDRIAKSEMGRNLREVEGACSSGRGSGNEDRVTEASDRWREA